MGRRTRMVAPDTGAFLQGGTALPMAAGAPLLRLHREEAQIGLATLTHSATGVILSSHAAGPLGVLLSCPACALTAAPAAEQELLDAALLGTARALRFVYRASGHTVIRLDEEGNLRLRGKVLEGFNGFAAP